MPNAERGTRNAEWMTVRLWDVVEIDRAGVDISNLEVNLRYLGLEHLDSDGRIRWGETVESAGVKSSKFRFTRKHVLFGKLRPYLRKVVRPEQDGVCSTDILPLLPKSGVDRDFIYHLLRTDENTRRATEACSGANLPRLSPEKFRAFEFRVPRSLPEQKRIAGILDAADRLRAQRRATLAQLDTLLQSTFLEMFGDPVSNPKGWEEAKLEDIAADTKLGLVRSSKEFGWEYSTRYVRMDAVTANGQFLPQKVQYTEATDKEKQAYALKAGDFLFNTRNSKELVGKVCIFPGPDGWLFNNNLMRIRFKDDIEPSVIATQFQFRRVQNELEQRKSGTTNVFAVYWKSLKTLPILIPPLDLQRRFAAIVESVEKQKARQRAHLAELDTLFASLQSRAFNGEL